VLNHKPGNTWSAINTKGKAVNRAQHRIGAQKSNTIAKRSKVNCSINWILTATSSRQARNRANEHQKNCNIPQLHQQQQQQRQQRDAAT